MNEIVQFAETWMDLETVIQSEVRENYRILMHICGIQKNGKDLICKAETDVEKGCGMNWEIGIDIYTLLITIQTIDNYEKNR